MRCSFALSAVAAVFTATTSHFASALESAAAENKVGLIEYDIASQFASFSVPLEAAHAYELVFSSEPVASQRRPDCLTALDVLILGRRAGLCFQSQGLGVAGAQPSFYITAQSNLSVEVFDLDGVPHAVNFTVYGYAIDIYSQYREGGKPTVGNFISVGVNVNSVDDFAVPGGTGFLTQYVTGSLAWLKATPDGRSIDMHAFKESFVTEERVASGSPQPDVVEDYVDILDELYMLRDLIAEAEMISAEITARKQTINRRIKSQKSKVPLGRLVRGCDGYICAARVIAERMCAKMSQMHDAPPAYEQLHYTQTQSIVTTPTGDLKPAQDSRNSSNPFLFDYSTLSSSSSHQSTKTQGAKPAATATHHSSLNDDLTLPDLLSPNSSSNWPPALLALSAFAAILGLTALYKFLRRKCASMRTRVERAADREERRTARAYRRAARRASRHRQWRALKSSLCCFGSADASPQVSDYEEKRALILQDALLEQSLEQAEKGQLMEAEIRALRHAHEIVAGLVGVHDPPPSLVPLPPPSRSRASTATLPSYASESLPEYSSQLDSSASSTPDLTDGSASVTDGFENYSPTSSDEDGQFTPTPPLSSTGTAGSRRTPVSSVVGLSPRCSAETLRTGRSRDSHDSL